MKKMLIVISLLLFAVLVTGEGDVWFSLRNTTYKNNSIVSMEDIGDSCEDTLNCITNLTACCHPDYTGESGHAIGNWFFPNGTRVLSTNKSWEIYRTRGQMVVRMHRIRGGEDGIYHCGIPDAENVTQSIYIGVYITAGSPTVTNLTLDDKFRTLTCTSTGGPATTVTWRRDGVVITLDATYQQTKTLVDPVNGTYQTVLTIDPSLDLRNVVGTYNCTVENPRGESSETVIVPDGVQFSLNGTIYKNNSLVTLENIGEGHNSLLCITNLTACCRHPYTNGSVIGNWFFPNGTRVVSTGDNWDFHRTRGQMVVHMRRKIGGEDGIYHCVIPDAENVNQTIYIGVYTESTGSPTVTSLTFDDKSRTLTCTSTGGPATTVTWRRDGVVITLDATYQQTKSLVDSVNGTYQTVLTIDPSLDLRNVVGTYNCTVENPRGESSETVIVPDGVQFSLNGTIYKNNSLVTLVNIGDGHNSLLCITNLTACCQSSYTGGVAIGNWFFPNGTRVPSMGKGNIYRTRGQMVVNMRQTIGGEDGIYHCVILDAENVIQTMYIGVYTVSTGSPTVTSLTYNDQSRTLTCISTGGPATTVTWRRDGVVITLDPTYQQTKSLVDPVNGTYQTVLTIDPSLDLRNVVGTYNCTVENARGESSEMVIIPDGVQFSLNGTIYKNNSLVTLENIGDGHNSLLCITNLTACCRPPYTSEMKLAIGNWFFPNGTRVVSAGNNWDFYRTRGQMVVNMIRRVGGEDGIYHCVIPDAENVNQTIYIGVYTLSTGSPTVTSLTYNDQSRTLTCISTGGPATTVTWRRDGVVITLDPTYQQTKSLVDPVNGTYQTVLTIDPSLDLRNVVGTYNCTVENARGESSETVIIPDGVQFSLNGTIYKNNSLVTLENIGDGHNSLLCITNLTACCQSSYTGGVAIGNWFFPNGTRVPSRSNWDIYRTRGQMMVNMRRTIGGEDGIYHCVIPDAENVIQTMYIGVYTVSTGSPTVTSLTFDDKSRTLTCISTGGPATTVTWRRDGVVITLGAIYQQTKSLVDPVNGTYQTVLTIDPSLDLRNVVGTYNCTVENARGEFSETVIVPDGVQFSLNGTIYKNNSLVTLENIGDGHNSLLCITNLTACCRPPYTSEMKLAIGNWFFPNGTRVVSAGNNWDFYRTRGQMVVNMIRRVGGEDGIYHCVIPDAENVNQTIYIGVYTLSTGSPTVTNLTYNDQSRTLTCISTGGPATIVTWRRDGVVITLSTTYQQTKSLVDPVNSTYQTVLTIDPSLGQSGIGGTYSCTVENDRGESSGTLVVPGQISIPENITFQLDTDPATDPPVFTLTCTSTGGPVTTVIWKRNGTILRDDSNHNITSQVIDPVNITYTNTLTVTGRLAGQYECNVSNIRTSPSETRHIRVVEADLPTNLYAVLAGNNSFTVSWTPSPSATVTGYQVYWSGGGEPDGSGNMSAGAGNSSLNITSSTLNSITIVALSDHLPSSVVSGAVFYYKVCEAEGIWNFTRAGTTSYFSCPENTVTITRTCNPSGVWEPRLVDFSLCIPFSSINIDDITLENFDKVLTSLSGAVRGAALSESEQTASNLGITSAVFTKSATLINPTVIIEDGAAQDQVGILGGLQQWKENVLQANASNIVFSFEEIVSVFAQRPRNETFSFKTNNILFSAESVSQNELAANGRSFSSSDQTNTTNISTLNEDETAAAFLPPSLFQSITNHGNIGSFYAVYNTGVLFPIAKAARTDQEMNTSVITVVGSPVLAVTIGLRQSFSGLTEPVRILLRLNDLGNVTSGRPRCASWDFHLKQWTTEGCETADINGSVVTCNCTHLTNFAILVDICSRFEDCMPSPVYATLEALTIIGVVLSLIGIIATIVTLLLFKKLRERDATRFHIQLCIALFCMLIIFVTGINQTTVYGGCVLVSVLIHYFTLVAVMWMGAEAVLMFQKLVIVFIRITTRYIIAVSLVCWLVPIIPVVIPMAVDLSDAVSRELIVHMPTTDVQGFCFISDPAVFFATFLGPIFVILIFNTVIFVMVIRVLIKHSRNPLACSSKQMDKKTAIRLVISIAGVMFLFGLTWLFGALTVTGFGDARASTAFQVLFVLLNAFQGFFICLFFCVFSKDARESWLELLSRAHGHYKSKSLYSSKTKYSSSGSNTIQKKSSTLSTNLPNPLVIPSNDLGASEVKEKEQMLEQSNDSEEPVSSSQWKEDGIELKACAKDLSTNEVCKQDVEGAKVLDNDKPDDTKI